MNGIILFEFCSAYPRSLFAKEVNKKRLEEINIKYQQLSSKILITFLELLMLIIYLETKVVKELKENGDKFSIF